MLGYVNRYIGAANVIRGFVKDYANDYKRADLTAQLRILRRRIGIARIMLLIGAVALILACLSMFLLFAGHQAIGETAFGLSLVGLISSLIASIYETSLSNKSLNIEIDDILRKEEKQPTSRHATE